jgi:hypothetical protein
MKILIPALAVLGGLILLTVNLIYAIRGRRRADRPVAPAAPENDNEFEVDSRADCNQSVTLDSDIEHRPCLNHFRLYSRIDSRYDIDIRESEYEYRTDDTKVFVRLLQDYSAGTGGEEWCVRGGVVMEDDMRARHAAMQVGVPARVIEGLRLSGLGIDESIADLKKKTEWSELLPSHWNGLKYFILSKKLPRERATK